MLFPDREFASQVKGKVYRTQVYRIRNEVIRGTTQTGRLEMVWISAEEGQWRHW